MISAQTDHFLRTCVPSGSPFGFWLRRCLASTLLASTTLGWIASHPSHAQAISTVESEQQSLTASSKIAATVSASKQGTQITLNGKAWPIAWSQWQSSSDRNSTRIGVSDTGLLRLMGVDFLNSSNPNQQPVQWFSDPRTNPLRLTTRLGAAYRYLDITDLASQAGWQLRATGNTLAIATPASQITTIRQGRQAWGHRIVIDLTRSTPWQIDQQGQTLVVTLAATASPGVVQQFRPAPKPSPTQPSRSTSNNAPSFPTTSGLPLQLETTGNQTILRVPLPAGLQPQIGTLPNPNRLVIDLRPDAMIPRDILWAPGLRWQQEYRTLGNARFPVTWLTVNPQQPGLQLKPIWSNPNSLVGIAPIAQTAQQWQAAAAINGGFFNRKNQMPLGAIRRDSQWISSPILNRGAIAWNNNGEVVMGRLTLQETVTNAAGQKFLILALNSGYVQAGIARYTTNWGSSYTPLTDNEVIVTVQNNQVTTQQPGGPAGQKPFPIPQNGYLLTLRANQGAAVAFPINSNLTLTSETLPSDFDRYPQVMGAGPLLIQNRQIVLNAADEKFSQAFVKEKASRSAIAQTADGNLLIVAVHNRVGGPGPTLSETAQIMQQMGAINALNLDGGSSTSLSLGGQLLDRSPRTAARVHNGIGIFLQSP